MDQKRFQSELLLLLTAVIWGFAFVAQRVGMEYVGPFTFNGIRFALGGIVLIPFIRRESGNRKVDGFRKTSRSVIYGGLSVGLLLFGGASLQQVGLVYTTAGNAGFITGLYVVIVPILGRFFGQRTGVGTWIGATLASIGLYLLSITENFSISSGDLLVLIGAVIWAMHVLLISWYSPRVFALHLAFGQFMVCSLLSLIIAAWREAWTLKGIIGAAPAIVYGGFLSVGVAYTLQVVAQKNAHPAHAAILLSLEAVFAAIGGWLLLGEQLSTRGFIGCSLMLAGMLLSQLWDACSRTRQS